MSRRGAGYGDQRRKARTVVDNANNPAITPQIEVIAGVDLVLAGTPQVIVG